MGSTSQGRETTQTILQSKAVKKLRQTGWMQVVMGICIITVGTMNQWNVKYFVATGLIYGVLVIISGILGFNSSKKPSNSWLNLIFLRWSIFLMVLLFPVAIYDSYFTMKYKFNNHYTNTVTLIRLILMDLLFLCEFIFNILGVMYSSQIAGRCCLCCHTDKSEGSDVRLVGTEPTAE